MILIIDSNKRSSLSISDIFYYMGILSRAVTPTEALGEISPAYRAVIIAEPQSLPDIDNFIDKLTSYRSDVMLFSISDDPYTAGLKGVFKKNYHSSTYSATLAFDISEYMRLRGVSPIGTYKLAGIDASSDVEQITVFDKPIAYTKTEAMILRYLICTYPIPQSPKSILKYAFKQNRTPDTAGIRTHISVMNKKFRLLREKNIIISIPEKGYVISTPEVISTFAEAN